MKAILIYHNSSGHNYFTKHYKKIVNELSLMFESLTIFETISMTEVKKIAISNLDSDVVLVAGGDGTFHNVINIYSKLALTTKVPKLAFFNNGTSCDILLNFGLTKKYTSTIKALKENSTNKIDVFKVNENYCIFMAAIGAFSDVAYTAKHKYKKVFKKLTYYFLSFKELFKKYNLNISCKIHGKSLNFNTNFLLLLNGKHIANFKINEDSLVNDNKIELMYSSSKIFHGLLSYFFKTKHLHIIQIDSATIKLNNLPNTTWCIDGELGPNGDVKVKVLPNLLEIYSFLEK